MLFIHGAYNYNNLLKESFNDYGGSRKLKPKSRYLHPKRRKRMGRPEQELQIGIFNFARPLMIMQKYRHFIAFHVPNGGHRTKAEAGIFKAMGVMPGVADICLLFPERQEEFVLDDGDPLVGIGHTVLPPRVCWLELKAGKGNTTDNQDAFGELMREYGFDYRVLAAGNVRDAVNRFQAILKEYGVPC